MIGSIIGGLVEAGASWLGAKEQQHQSDRLAWWQANQLKKAGKEFDDDFQSIMDDILADPSGYAGSRVMPAMYRPTSLDESLQDVLGANSGQFNAIANLIAQSNQFTTANDMGRIEEMAPGTSRAMESGMGNAASMMAGVIPDDVREQVFANRAGMSAATGAPGGASSMVARDLGLTSLDMMQQGTSLFGNIVNAAQTISPVNRQMAPAQMMYQPSAGVSLNLEQAQLMQNSQQNAYNLLAAPDPALSMIAQLQATQALTKAGISSSLPIAAPQAMTPYAQIYGQIGGAMNNAIQGLFGGGGRTSYGSNPYGSPTPYGTVNQNELR